MGFKGEYQSDIEIENYPDIVTIKARILVGFLRKNFNALAQKEPLEPTLEDIRKSTDSLLEQSNGPLVDESFEQIREQIIRIDTELKECFGAEAEKWGRDVRNTEIFTNNDNVNNPLLWGIRNHPNYGHNRTVHDI